MSLRFKNRLSITPVSGGFRVNFNYPFDYEAGGDKLWVKAMSNIKSNSITIAD